MRSIDLEFGFRQLASMLQSGLSLLSALRTAARQAQRRSASRLWDALADRIETGLSPEEAFAAARAFDDYTLALLRVGAQSGELDAAFSRAAAHVEQTRAARALLANALVYPVLVLLLTAGVVAFMVLKVIPQVRDFLLAGQQALPPLTQTLLDISDALRLHAPAIGLALLLLVALRFALRAYPPTRLLLDSAALRVPVSGRLLRLSATARFSRGLSILLDSGIPLLSALDTAATLLPNTALKRRVTQAAADVLRGATLADALAPATEFFPMLPKMVAVGETTGTLIEPILILVVGGIVGFVYTAFFMALFSLASAAG